MMPMDTVDGVQAFVARGLDEVRLVLAAHLARVQAELPAAGADYRDLWDAVGDLHLAGKNLRPMLTLAAYSGLGGRDTRAIAPIAAAVEMLHAAMLIHDDLLDGDEVRRGRPNVAGARRIALEGTGLSPAQVEAHVRAAAVLGGDLALSSAYDLVARADIASHHRIACLDLLTRAVRTTIAGELRDMYADARAPEDAEPLVIAELKTATYSVVVPLLAGAQLAGADPTMTAHLERLGTALGLSFQLVDDDLGVFGDPAVTGKSVLSDLRAGKRTELMRLGFAHADAAGRAVLAGAVGDPALDEAAAARVREVLVSSGARERALLTARQQARIARRIAYERIPAPLSGYLVDLIATLEERTS
ncbi:polyprenyl synthetase family protein [Demequina iriomotensis]|uniref:polyprenyl synthetase family protein n=1 Tax=Demequina iriomotensis TaxID=1536641 RepID=UPI0009E1CDCB|nr:polyprenyl synthetase family protein [Demequina iriomotensis]